MPFTVIPREPVAAVLPAEPRPQGGLAAKYHVTLREEDRARLEALTQCGRIAARTLEQAWSVLKAEASPGGPAGSDARIRAAFGVGWSTIARVPHALVEDGRDAVLYPQRPPPRLPTQRDGAHEAHLIHWPAAHRPRATSAGRCAPRRAVRLVGGRAGLV